MKSIPFPQTPDPLRERYAVEGLSLRPFGTELEDLSLDFGDPDRPRLEREILVCCARTGTGAKLAVDLFLELELGKRTEALLHVMAVTLRTGLDVHFPCVNPECGETMEVELGVDELSTLQESAEVVGPPAVMIGGERFPLRRPTGLDQVAWQGKRYADERSASAAMAESLVPEEFRLHFRRAAGRDNCWVKSVESALEEADPLVDFRLRVNCPFCQSQGSYQIDLAEHALRRLKAAQQALVASVHRLAAKYHWSELEIFDVPAWRRKLYLSMIDREENR